MFTAINFVKILIQAPNGESLETIHVLAWDFCPLSSGYNLTVFPNQKAGSGKGVETSLKDVSILVLNQSLAKCAQVSDLRNPGKRKMMNKYHDT